MKESLHFDKAKPSPTLKTILMVEDTIKNYPNSVVTVAELKRALPKQVNHTTLMTILEYLEKSNKIAVGLRGITWIQNENKNLRHVAIHGLEL
jgi:exosome complex RNA-binding protein Rrp4